MPKSLMLRRYALKGKHKDFKKQLDKAEKSEMWRKRIYGKKGVRT